MLTSTVRLHPSSSFIWGTDALRMCWAGSQVRKADLSKKSLGFHALSHILRTWPGHWRKIKSILEFRHTCHLCIYPQPVTEASPLTPATHCFLPEHLRTDHSTTQLPWPEKEAFLVWHARVSDPYSVVLFCLVFLITTRFSKPED